MTSSTADVVVIGGGVNGTSIAMHLARMGAGKVVLVEKGHLAGGATGRSGAMVREHYLHPTLVRMATESREIFQNFGDAIGGEPRFVQGGRILMFPERDEPAVRANVEMNRDLGVNIETLTPAEVAGMVPESNVEDIAIGTYEPDAGHADPVATTYAYAERARDYGAEIHTQTPVSGLVVSGGRITGVETSSGIVETSTVVAAVGPWCHQLGAAVGESLPVTPIRVQMVHMRRPPPLENLNTNIIDYSTGRTSASIRGPRHGYRRRGPGRPGGSSQPGRVRTKRGPRRNHALLGPRQAEIPRIRIRDLPWRLWFSIRHDTRWQSNTGPLSDRRRSLLGSRIQRPWVQTVAGCGPHGCRASAARGVERPSCRPVQVDAVR